MDRSELYAVLDFPQEVAEELHGYWKNHTSVLNEDLEKRLLNRAQWDGAIKEIQEKVGEDPNGFYILAELMDFCRKTFDEYEKMGIDRTVFAATMKFCTRFIHEHKAAYGNYEFQWAWWFPRQLSMQEYRVEELEFEFIEEEQRIYIHIPSDADMRPSRVQDTFKAFHAFLKKYYPKWLKAEWYCDSWMLSPVLDQLLDENSNVLQFNHLFQIESVDYDSLGALDWVFPGKRVPIADLQENTSLQKRMKKYLLGGGKVGWAKGKVKQRYLD